MAEVAADETAAQRFARDWAAQEADRKARGLDAQPVERKGREYVDASGDSATT